MPAEPSDLFYGELAPWWPLISPLDDYAEEAAYVRGLLENHPSPVRDVLELGSGGGHNAFFLKHRFDLTLSDRSEAMVIQSKTLNPECAHVVGDMCSLRLGRTFDAVFIHDAIDYMTNETDLRAALTTAFEHLRPGGVAVLVPDATTEIFEPSHDAGGSDGADRSVRFMEWTFDPDPTDAWVQTEYVFALRVGDADVQLVHETHRTGLFDRATWRRLLDEIGFDARRISEITTEDRPGRDVFLAVRPDPLLDRVAPVAAEIDPGPVLHGRLVRLRPATRNDLARIVEIRSTPEVRERWMGEDLAAEFLEDIAATDLHLLVIEDEHGTVIGGLQWQEEADPMYRHAGIDVYVDPSRHRRGYGTDAVRTLATDLIRTRGHHRLVIDPAADNVAAIACYQRVGFRPVGVLRAYERGHDGTWHDGLLMELIADDLIDDLTDGSPLARRPH